MNIEQERLKWKHNEAEIDKLVDNMVDNLRRTDVIPVAYMVMDMVYRPYLRWIHSAQCNGVNPTNVRHTLIYLLSTIILESTMRVSSNDESGNPIPLEERVRFIIEEVSNEVEASIEKAITMGRARGNA